MVPEELDLGFPARSDGRSSEAAADLRHSGAGWPARAGGLLLLHRRYPGVQPGRYLRSFYAFYTGIIFNFESCFGGKW